MVAKPAGEGWASKMLDKVPAWLLISTFSIIVIALVVFSSVLVHAYYTGRLLEAFGIKMREAEQVEEAYLGNSLPIGAVLAFDKPSGCPKGWVRFWQGGGRFIVGAASESELNDGPASFRNDSNGEPLKPRPFGGSDGAQEVKLEPMHMPKHQHEVRWQGTHTVSLEEQPEGQREVDLADKRYLLTRAEKAGWEGLNMRTTEDGASVPHNNMPPYIALHFCKYEGKG